MPDLVVGAHEIIHEQTGLQIRKNAKNRFTIISLYYYADPAKRSSEWAAEARAGMSDAQWAKEYLIDATALFGEKTFPEIIANRSRIVVAAPCPEVPPTAPCWGGLDYGVRNPSSFHVYTKVDGVTYAVWELYEPCKNLSEFAQKIKDCPFYPQLKYIAADPTMIRNKTQQRSGGIVSVGTLLIEEGIHKLIPGNQDESSWVAMMRDHWKKADDPTFRIYETCPNLIREFEAAVFVNLNDRQKLQGDSYSESILDKNNHALDDCKYFMNSLPSTASTNIKAFNHLKLWLK